MFPQHGHSRLQGHIDRSVLQGTERATENVQHAPHREVVGKHHERAEEGRCSTRYCVLVIGRCPRLMVRHMGRISARSQRSCVGAC